MQIVMVEGISVVNFFAPPIQIWGYDYDRGPGKIYAQMIEKLLLRLKRPLIICGDFNYNEPEDIYPRFSKKCGLSEALPKEITRPTTNNNFENPDHIFYSSEFLCTGAKVIKTNTDHFLCIAELEMN